MSKLIFERDREVLTEFNSDEVTPEILKEIESQFNERLVKSIEITFNGDVSAEQAADLNNIPGENINEVIYKLK